LKSTEPFDERRPGLDHLAFACNDRSELEDWERRLNELGVTNGGIVDAPYGSGLSFRDPNNIALEFFAPPGYPSEPFAEHVCRRRVDPWVTEHRFAA
jgi:catechol-2,3-dioxygenase